MKKIFIVLLSLLMLASVLTACDITATAPKEIDVNFLVDGEVYHTVSTTGEVEVVMPQDPVKDEYVFEGWYFDNNTFENPFTATSLVGQDLNDDITLYAKFRVADVTERYYSLTFNSMGGSEVESQSILYGNVAVEPVAPTQVEYIFEGWFKEADCINEWDFVLDTVTEATTLYAKWILCTEHIYENKHCTKCGAPLYKRVDEDTILFGEYPQTKVTDETLISSLNNMAGTLPTNSNFYNWTSYGYYIEGVVSNFMWYIDVVGDEGKYRGVYFTSYRPEGVGGSSSTSNTCQDNNGYLVSNVYWFEYEPISWTILEEKGGNAFLCCDMIIDSQQFDYEDDEYSNNYAESTIRRWLNETFYNTAFNQYEQGIILTTTVDNSVESTGSSENPCACEDTEDKVFLLSFKEATTYCFAENLDESDPARQKKTTDYAQAQGAYTYSGSTEECLGNGYWRLRSPFSHDSYDSYYALRITFGGSIDIYGGVDITEYGIVPALWIEL